MRSRGREQALIPGALDVYKRQPTASGKTLAFLLPVLQEILADPLTRAVFIYPTKALAGRCV